MICDFDDFHPGNTGYELLFKLKEANPSFRCTLFAVPGLGSDQFWDDVPDWCELAAHGWRHGGHGCPDAREAENWSYDMALAVLLSAPVRFVEGWKSPGWQISDGTYEALVDLGWWCADQHLEDHRRPDGLRTYFYEDSVDRWHGHIQNVCSNGLEETFPDLIDRVTMAQDFQFVSEAVVPWRSPVAA
jgi:hypothetical protein